MGTSKENLKEFEEEVIKEESEEAMKKIDKKMIMMNFRRRIR